MNRSAPALFFCFDKSGDFYRRIPFCQEYGSCSWSLEEFPAKRGTGNRLPGARCWEEAPVGAETVGLV